MVQIDEEKREKLIDRLGVYLLCGILIVSGLILAKDKEKPIEFRENVAQEQTSQATKDVKAAETTTTPEVKGKININQASIEDLDTLPGIGAITAQKIIDFRKQNGGFKSIEGIMDVSGIGEAKFAKIKDLISI